MRAEYKRDMNHNYLILYEEEEIDTSSYQVRMLVGNAIPSVLKCRVQGMDGRFMIYYDITSRQSVTALFGEKKLGYEDLQLIFGGFVQVMEEMSEYLLNPEQLVIRPEYLYVDLEKREMFFCYLPGYEQDVRKQFQELTEYILPKLDHEDSRAVMLGYGVYRRALEDSFHLEHIKEELYREREDSPGNPPLMEKVPAEREKWEEKENPVEDIGEKLWECREENEEGEAGKGSAPLWVKILSPIIGAVLGMLVLGAKFMGYLPDISLGVVLGIVIVLLAGGMAIAFFVGRKASRKAEGDKKGKCKEEYKEEYKEECGKSTVKEQWEEVKELCKEKGKDEEENYGETVVLSAASAAGPASFVSREPGELAAIYLKEELTVVGKLVNAADAVVNLPTVSRVHAKIRRRDGEYYLTDLNSRNGTAVNGQMLKPDEEYLLQDQDEVDFAQARYVFLK